MGALYSCDLGLFAGLVFMTEKYFEILKLIIETSGQDLLKNFKNEWDSNLPHSEIIKRANDLRDFCLVLSLVCEFEE